MENKWQRHYRETHCGGNVQKDSVSKEEYELLGNVGDTVTVHFPKTKREPAHTETLEVRFTECNIPEGYISVNTLASNLRMWAFRGFRIDW